MTIGSVETARSLMMNNSTSLYVIYFYFLRFRRGLLILSLWVCGRSISSRALTVSVKRMLLGRQHVILMISIMNECITRACFVG